MYAIFICQLYFNKMEKKKKKNWDEKGLGRYISASALNVVS